MKYFKHYSNARASNKLTLLFAKTGLEGYARYWLLLEEMAFKFDGKDTTFVFSAKDLKDILGFYHMSQMLMYLQCMSDVGLMSFQCEQDVVSISTPILLELQSRDFKKARAERGIDKDKDKDKDKKKSSKCTQTKFEHPSNLQDFLAIFDQSTFAHWLSIYQNDGDWINRELEKCYGYFYVQKTGKPSSSVKGWKSRASSWLERGWNSFSKNKPANHSTPQLKNSHLLKMLEETK